MGCNVTKLEAGEEAPDKRRPFRRRLHLRRRLGCSRKDSIASTTGLLHTRGSEIEDDQQATPPEMAALPKVDEVEDEKRLRMVSKVRFQSGVVRVEESVCKIKRESSNVFERKFEGEELVGSPSFRFYARQSLPAVLSEDSEK